MRRRLTISILILVAGILFLAGLGSFYLIERASTATAEQGLSIEAHSLTHHPKLLSKRLIPLLREVGGYHSLTVIGVNTKGVLGAGLAQKLGLPKEHHQNLLKDHRVLGRHNSLVYILVPLSLDNIQKERMSPPIPPNDKAVLVATRTIKSPVSGLVYFLLLALGALAIATGIAFSLANRFARPLLTLADVTHEISKGNLASRVHVDHLELPEFKTLANSINSMGESLERARDQQRQFLLSVSHDLRTPLTSIRGYGEAIAEGAIDDPQAAAQVICSESQRLERLVRDLIDLARLDSQYFSFSPTPTNAYLLINEVANSFKHSARKLGISLTVIGSERNDGINGDPDDPSSTLWLVIDSDRLSQALSNLIENALRFARHEILIGAEAKDEGISIWVKDDGVGISPKDLPRLFERHFTSDREDSTRSRIGLGLAIVAELTEAMRGRYSVESPLGAKGGSCITLWFPLSSIKE